MIDVRRFRLPLLLLLLTAWIVAPALAQDWAGRGRLSGVVTDEAGEPIQGATVTLRVPGTDKGPDPLTTNKRGRWSYLGLTGGTWEISIEYPGFAASVGTAPVTEFGAGQTINTTLKPASAVAAAAADVDAEAVAAAEEATAKLSEASALLDQGNYVEARVLMEEALENLDESKQAEVLLAMAKTHYQEDDMDATIATLERALAADPEHVESLKLISSVLMNEGRVEDAEVYMARLPEGEKVDPNALLNQGIQKYNANDLDGALADFDRIVSEYPDLPEAYYYRGLVHIGKGNSAEAIADFQKMLELAPDHANATEARQFLEYLESQ